MTKLTLVPVPKNISDAAVITLVKKAEKRGACAGAFALYKPGMTVAAFKAAYKAWQAKGGEVTKGPALGHVKWDFAHGFITLAAK